MPPYERAGAHGLAGPRNFDIRAILHRLASTRTCSALRYYFSPAIIFLSTYFGWRHMPLMRGGDFTFRPYAAGRTARPRMLSSRPRVRAISRGLYSLSILACGAQKWHDSFRHAPILRLFPYYRHVGRKAYRHAAWLSRVTGCRQHTLYHHRPK